MTCTHYCNQFPCDGLEKLGRRTIFIISNERRISQKVPETELARRGVSEGERGRQDYCGAMPAGAR